MHLNTEKILKWLLRLFLFALPWQTVWIYEERTLNGSKWEYGTLQIFATEILLGVTAVFFIFWYWRNIKSRGKVNFTFSKDRLFVLSCLAFIVYGYLVSFWATDAEIARQQVLHLSEALLLLFIVVLGPLRKNDVAQALVAGAIVPSLLGIAQFLTQSTWSTTWFGLALHPASVPGTSIISSEEIGRWLRAYGTFSHPNVFGGYLVLVLYFILNTSRTDFTKQRYLSPISYLLTLTALVFTFSRTAWLAAAILLVWYGLTLRHRKQPIISRISYLISLIFITLLFFMYHQLVFTRVSATSPAEVRSTEERAVGYREAVQIFKTHPWVGVGPGHYTAAAFAENPRRPGYEYQPVHNVLLLFVVEWGIVGAVLACIIISYLVWIRQAHHKPLISSIRATTPGYEIGDKRYICFFIILPLFLLDHYLYSSYTGLLLLPLFFYPQIIHLLSTKGDFLAAPSSP